MVKESEIQPGAFKALLTGYGMLGPYDYAHFPASSVPELSLAGDKPFTLFTSVCFKNVQGGAILTQNDVFRFGIIDGQLYVAAVDWCAVKFSEYTLGRFTTDQWYALALVYDGSLLSVYLNGEKKDTFRCNPEKGKLSASDWVIGEKLDAYFKTFRLFGKALSDREVSQLSSSGGITPADSIAWFDFDQTGRKDRSNNRVKLTTKAFARIVMVHPVPAIPLQHQPQVSQRRRHGHRAVRRVKTDKFHRLRHSSTRYRRLHATHRNDIARNPQTSDVRTGRRNRHPLGKHRYTTDWFLTQKYTHAYVSF